MNIVSEFTLWNEKVPLPPVGDLTRPDQAIDVVVHRADETYQFLHDNAVVWHSNTLVAGWYNCPRTEIVDSSCIRGRRSLDGGKTWSSAEMIAPDKKIEGVFYVPVAFLSHGSHLLAFVSKMTGHDLITHCEVFTFDELNHRWHSGGHISGPFLPNSAPQRMEDGNFLMAGRMASRAGEKPETPAVAISAGEDVIGQWKVVPMVQGTSQPYTAFPESTIWQDGQAITAIVRGGLVFTSKDYGQTWAGPFQHNLPAEDSKLYVLKLSTGQLCMVWNYPESPQSRRQLLTIAVSRPGEKTLVSIWKIRHGHSDELQAGPEWSYPCAIEHEGALYVIYTSEKKHSIMTIIPIDSIGTN